MDFEVLGGTLRVAGTASLLAGVSITADGLLWLVSWVVLTTNDAEQLLHRHLHQWLVGTGLGGGIDGERKSRQGGEGFCEHFGVCVEDRRGVLEKRNVQSIDIDEIITGKEPDRKNKVL